MEESTIARGRRKSVQEQDLFITAVDLPRSDGDEEIGHARRWIAKAHSQRQRPRVCGRRDPRLAQAVAH